MMSSRIRAVAFDMDGLMFNTEDLYVEAGIRLLDRRGMEARRDVFDLMMGRPSFLALEILREHFGLLESVAALEAEVDAIFDELLPRRLECLPGLIELLSELERRDIPKAIGTGSKRNLVHRSLELTGLSGRFTLVVSSQDVEHGKPHPQTYQTIHEHFGIPARELLVLEDSFNGCQAGLAAGATVVAVPCAHSRHHDFQGVSLIADSLHDHRLWQLLFDDFAA